MLSRALLALAVITVGLGIPQASAQATARFFHVGASLQARFGGDTRWRDGVVAVVGDCVAFRPVRDPKGDTLAAALGGGVILRTLPDLERLRLNVGTASAPSWLDVSRDTLRLLQDCHPTDPSLPTP